MKKTLITVLLTMLFISISVICVADAEIDYGEGVSFSIYAQCKEQDTYTDSTSFGYKTTEMAAVFVEHSVSGSSYICTNHFRVRKESGSDLISCGSNWCTIGSPSIIKGDTIDSEYNYTIAGRGNTKHYYDGGIENLTLFGTFYVNATEK